MKRNEDILRNALKVFANPNNYLVRFTVRGAKLDFRPDLGSSDPLEIIPWLFAQNALDKTGDKNE